MVVIISFCCFKELERQYADELSVLRTIVKFPQSVAIFKQWFDGNSLSNEQIRAAYLSLVSEKSLTKLQDATHQNSELDHLLAYISQSLYKLTAPFEKQETEALIFKLLSASLRKQLDQNLIASKSFAEQSKLVKKYNLKLGKLNQLNHKGVTPGKDQYNRYFDN